MLKKKVVIHGSLQSASVLEELEFAGEKPNYSCRDGYCGSCRIKIHRGNVEWFKDPVGYFEKENQEVLACAVRRSCQTLEVGI